MVVYATYFLFYIKQFSNNFFLASTKSVGIDKSIEPSTSTGNPI